MDPISLTHNTMDSINMDSNNIPHSTMDSGNIRHYIMDSTNIPHYGLYQYITLHYRLYQYTTLHYRLYQYTAWKRFRLNFTWLNLESGRSFCLEETVAVWPVSGFGWKPPLLTPSHLTSGLPPTWYVNRVRQSLAHCYFMLVWYDDILQYLMIRAYVSPNLEISPNEDLGWLYESGQNT